MGIVSTVNHTLSHEVNRLRFLMKNLLEEVKKHVVSFIIALPTRVLGGGGSHVAHLNFKTSRVGVYKCLSLIVGFADTVAIWPREVVFCRDFILHTVTTFWTMSLVGIYPGRASL